MPPTPLRTIEALAFDARLGNRSVYIYPRSAPDNSHGLAEFQ